MDSKIVYFGTQSIFGILFLVLFFLNRSSYRERGTHKIDALFIVFVITLVLDSAWVFIDGVPEYRTWHIALETTYLSLMACTGYLWFLYTLDFFPAKSLKLRDYKFLLGIPVLIEIALIIISIKTGWIFEVDAGGTYIRGDYHIYTVLLNYLYMLFGSYVAIKCRREALLPIDKRRYTVAALFPLPVLVLSGIQMLLPPGFPSMQGGVLIGLLLLYGGSQNALVSRDFLTGLPNRIAFENELTEQMQKYRSDGPNLLYLMEGDIDNFKQINDTFGHPVGDKVLKHAADVLCQVFSPYGSVFRIGGDEFMIIAEADDHFDINELRNRLNEQLSLNASKDEMNISMSLGIMKYDGKMSFREFIDNVDKDLYTDKGSRLPHGESRL